MKKAGNKKKKNSSLFFFKNKAGTKVFLVPANNNSSWTGIRVYSSLNEGSKQSSSVQTPEEMWYLMGTHPFEGEFIGELEFSRMSRKLALMNLSYVIFSDIQILWDEEKITEAKFKKLAKKYLSARNALMKVIEMMDLLEEN